MKARWKPSRAVVRVSRCIMDIYDKAQTFDQMHRDIAIAAQARKAIKGASLSHCVDCGEKIPPDRAALGGMIRCFECQTDFEKLERFS